MSYLDDVIKVARQFDAARPRSTQSAVGWSEVSGCRAHLGYRLAGEWPTDNTDTWAAQRGTAIHEYLQMILRADRPRLLTEVTTKYRGIPGHADLVELDPPSVTDIKTTRLANARIWASTPAVLHGKLIQVAGYTAGLVEQGMLPAETTMRLLVIPVDGTYDDWFCFEQPYDQALADEGADRLDWVRAQDGQAALPKDMPYAWCESYCEFFTLCRGAADPDDSEVIADPELRAAVAKYGETTQLMGQLKRQQAGLAEVVRGLRGVAGDWRISLSKPGVPSLVLDENTVRADYADRGVDVPEITKAGSSPRLSVTKVRRTPA